MKLDQLKALDKELARYDSEIEVINTEIFWSCKEHDMRMRNLNKQKEDIEAHIKSTEEARELVLSVGVL